MTGVRLLGFDNQGQQGAIRQRVGNCAERVHRSQGRHIVAFTNQVGQTPGSSGRLTTACRGRTEFIGTPQRQSDSRLVNDSVNRQCQLVSVAVTWYAWLEPRHRHRLLRFVVA
jgi:hypothetical protein